MAGSQGVSSQEDHGQPSDQVRSGSKGDLPPQPAPAEAPPQGERAWWGRLVVMGLALFVALAAVWGGVLHQLFASRDAAIEVAQKHAQKAARIASAHMDATAGLVNSKLAQVETIAWQSRDAGAPPLDPTVRKALEGLLTDNDPIAAHVIVDAEGRVDHIALAEGEPSAPQDPNTRPAVSDRPYFRYFSERSVAAPPDHSLYIGVPVQGLLTGQWLLPMARGLYDTEDRFDGIVVAMVALDRINALYQSLDLANTRNALSLLRRDGIMLARSPDDPSLIGRSFLGSPLFKNLAKAPEGVYRTRVLTDGQDRIVAYRESARYPLVIALGLHTDNALAAWRRVAIQLGLAGGAVTLVLFGIAFMLLRYGSQRERAAIAASEARFRSLVENTNVVAWELDLNSFQFTYVSPHAEAMLGHPLEAWYQPGFWEAHILPEDRENAITTCVAATEAGKDHEFEYRMIKADGTPIWLRDIVTVHPGKTGKAASLSGFMVDIDQQKRMEKANRDQTLALQRSNEELEQFAYVASHDLQEPLRMISSYLQLLERRYGEQLDGPAREYIDYAVNGARRMNHLIKDLLQFSRVSTRPGALDSFPIAELVAEALQNLRRSIEEKGADIHLGPLPRLKGDRRQLVSVFQNLISNALKYQAKDRPPEIHIGAQKQEDPAGWVFYVEDNGIGIAPEYKSRIFGVFQRLHVQTEYSGTGIGLAIVKKIIERHGGHIWVDSTEGEGSRFSFFLPEKNQTEEETG